MRDLILEGFDFDGLCRGLTTLWAARVNNGLELEVTDPQENQGEIEQEDGKS